MQAEKATCEAHTVWILREQAHAQRVLTEAQRVRTESTLPPHKIPDLELEEMPTNSNNKNQGIPKISQEDNDDDDGYI